MSTITLGKSFNGGGINALGWEMDFRDGLGGTICSATPVLISKMEESLNKGIRILLVRNLESLMYCSMCTTHFSRFSSLVESERSLIMLYMGILYLHQSTEAY
jgi:hypothetical protein